jgi:hypothetical protein
LSGHKDDPLSLCSMFRFKPIDVILVTIDLILLTPLFSY